MRRYNRTRVVVFNAPSAAMWGRPITSRRQFKAALYGLIALTVFGFCLAFYVTTSHTDQRRDQTPQLSWLDLTWEAGLDHQTAGHTEDGLDITWYNELHTRARLQSALATMNAKVMFEGNVGLHLLVLPDPVEELLMTSSNEVVGDISLEEWLDMVIASGKGGIKLNFKDADGFEQALTLLADRTVDLRETPVWVTVSVASGPGGAGEGLLDAGWYTRIIDRTFPQAQLVFGWTYPCCEASGDSSFGRGNMETMLSVCRSLNRPVVISAPAVKAASAWQHFRWLLERSEKLRLLLWSPQNDSSWTNSSVYDLLIIRNDWSKRRIFYDLPEERLQEFRQVASTAGSPLVYFDVLDMDAGKVTWDHSANSMSHLSRALRGEAMMLEADVALQGQGTPNQTDLPVMTHRSPLTTSNFTLSQWLDLVLTSKKGIKLDFKSTEVIVPALKVLREKRAHLQRPVWINGDILRGPNGLHDPMRTDHLLHSINAIFPEVTVSLGWTSGWTYGHDNEAYSWEMVERMEKNARKVHQPVTFAVRAVLARRSWEKFDWLLRQSRRYTVTLWAPVTSHDKIMKSDMDYVRQQSERGRVYFDIPQDVMPSLH